MSVMERAAKPANYICEISLCVKALVAIQLARNVRRFSIIEQYDANISNHTAGFVNAMAYIVRLASSAESGSRSLSALEALEPAQFLR